MLTSSDKSVFAHFLHANLSKSISTSLQANCFIPVFYRPTNHFRPIGLCQSSTVQSITSSQLVYASLLQSNRLLQANWSMPIFYSPTNHFGPIGLCQSSTGEPITSGPFLCASLLQAQILYANLLQAK